MDSFALSSFLAESRARLLATLETVPSELLTKRPAPERWSPLEIVEHLAIAEEWYIEIVTGLIAEGRQKGLWAKEGAPRLIDSLPTLSEQVDVRAPMKAADFAQPTGKVALPETLVRLAKSRETLLGLIPAMNELDTDQLIYEHPTIHFRLNAYQWVHLSGMHDRQHARQLRHIVAG